MNHMTYWRQAIVRTVNRIIVSRFYSGKTMGAPISGKYPAKAHALKVVEYIRGTKKDATGVLYLEGQVTRMKEDNDEPQEFR
jgi:hypothetical protein